MKQLDRNSDFRELDVDGETLVYLQGNTYFNTEGEEISPREANRLLERQRIVNRYRETEAARAANGRDRTPVRLTRKRSGVVLAEDGTATNVPLHYLSWRALKDLAEAEGIPYGGEEATIAALRAKVRK